MSWNTQDITKALGTKPLDDFCQNSMFEPIGFSIDSRTIQSSQVFICLKGEQHDGHNYIKQALASGACGLIIEEAYIDNLETLPKHLTKELTIFSVPDGLKALQNLASYHRQRLRAKVIGVTGSNGKTSCKEILTHLLQVGLQSQEIHATQGNLNNHIGLPLSLLKAKPQDRYVILEMGMNHSREIALLSNIAKPNHAIITCIAGAHRQFFSSLDDIARAKLEIIEAMPASNQSHLAYHVDSHGTQLAIEHTRKKAIHLDLFGIITSDNSSTVKSPSSLAKNKHISLNYASDLRVSTNGIEYTWQGLNIHCPHLFHPAMAVNLVGCLTLLANLGLEPNVLQTAVNSLSLISKRRFEVIRKQRPGQVAQLLVDDSYNANPDSFVAAIQALRMLLPKGRLGLLMGEMGELGQTAQEGHERVGAAAGQAGYAILGLVQGEFSPNTATHYQQQNQGKVIEAKSSQSLVELLEKENKLQNLDGILVKGSRLARMDIACDYLRNRHYV